MSAKAIAGTKAALRMRAALLAAVVVTLALALSTTAHAATITLDSLADTDAPGICVLRDAITAANTMTAINGCVAGDGNDTVNFSVTGTIVLGSTLPQVTDRLLTINGPAVSGITIDGGGAVQVMQVAFGATLDLTNLTISHAETHVSGGGIYNGGETLTVTNSTFSGNSVALGGGGGISSNGMLTVTNSTFSGNRGASFGGGINNATGTLTVTNSIFSGNRANFGGGIGSDFGTLTVVGSTFVRNISNYPAGGLGGGIFTGFGTPTVTNNTFSGNSATLEGGGIGNRLQHATVRLKSTILAANSGNNCAGPIADAGYNISDDSSCGFSSTGSSNNTDPMLDPSGLRRNGSPTRTIALLSGSPAIDAIPLADCTDQASPRNPLITDQRLFPRPDASEQRCDIGAYEVQDTAFITFFRFQGSLKIHPDVSVFRLNGGFELGSQGSIDPITEPVAFSAGSYAIRLPVGSFVTNSSGYVYQKTVHGIFLCIFIKFTDTPGSYQLLVYRKGGALPTSPVPVTLTIGDNSGSTLMNATLD